MDKNTKFVFFGTPEFAAIVLEKIIAAGFIPSAVLCNPDRPVGRKKIITPPPTKVLAEKNNIKVYQPEKLEISPPAGGLDLEIGKIDFAVVAAYSKIIPKKILEIPRLGTIGVHPSLLPKYRGASPIQSAILAGEKETGVTLFLTDEKVDHGPILAKRELTMTNDDDYDNLQKRLADLAADLLIETLPKFLTGEIKPRTQNESEATYTKKFRAEDGFVDLEILRQAQDGTSPGQPEIILRKIRALNPEPGVWTIIPPTGGGKRTKILEAEIANGKLRIKKIQIEGGKQKNLSPT